MVINLPEPVAAYLAAEKAKDTDATARCFAENGTVRDEGNEYRGRDAIRKWKADADAKYQYVLQPLDVQADGPKVTVRARVAGNFPGSPVELEHTFELSDNKIASLEIRP